MDFLLIEWWPTGSLGSFMLFLLPFGPGATAGILVGKNGGVSALAIALLYLAADAIRALYFERALRLAVRLGSRRAWSRTVGEQISEIAARTRLGSSRLAQLSSLTLLSLGGGFTIGSVAVASASVSRVLGWSAVILGDVSWFCVKLVAALSLASVLPDDRLVFVGVVALAMLASLVAQRCRRLLPAVQAAEVFKSES